MENVVSWCHSAMLGGNFPSEHSITAVAMTSHMSIRAGIFQLLVLGYCFSQIQGCYNKCIKKLFGYERCDSVSGILIQLGLPTADTIVHNSHVLFASHCLLSCNQIVQWLANIAVW